MRVFWKPYRQRHSDGTWEVWENTCLNDRAAGRLLLEAIQAMPGGNPISFEDASHLADQERERIRAVENRFASELFAAFVPYIQSLGYQIVLRGDEFEVRDEPEVHIKSDIEKEWDEHPEPHPVVCLTVRLQDYIFKLTTLKQRPPISGMRRIDENQIEILYETGARELAKRTNPEEHSYLIVHLMAEIWHGEAPTVEPFAWAA